METIAGGKTPGLCLVEALPAEVVALGISICDTTRDGSRIVGYTEVIQDGHRADQYPGSRPVFRNSDRASTPGYRDPGAFVGTNPTGELITHYKRAPLLE
jgi:hypothetical protein